MNGKTTILAVLGAAGVLCAIGLSGDVERDIAIQQSIAQTTEARQAETSPASAIRTARIDGESAFQAAAIDNAALELAPAPRATVPHPVTTRPENAAERAMALRLAAERGDVEPGSKMNGRLAAIAAAGGSAPVDLVVDYATHPALFDDEVVAALGGEVLRAYNHLEMRAVRLPAGELAALAADDRIDWLSLDAPVAGLSEASRIAANVPLASGVNASFDGDLVGVAIIDSGISKHSVLADAALQFNFNGGHYPQPQLVGGVVTVANDSARDDKFGHGTHVAGIVAGLGTDSAGLYQGSSQGAGLLSLKVLDQHGNGQMSDVIAALDWLLSYGDAFGIRVVNLSLGQSVSQSASVDPLVLAAEALWDAGFVVVVAAGNDGHNGNFTINSPGNSRKLITVGSLTDSGTGADSTDDYVSSFSSRGPTVGDLVLKPDLLAPGNKVVAAIPNSSNLKSLLPDRVKTCPNGCQDIYLELSGTSMATPLVAAAAARMLSKEPTLSPDTIKARLMRSASKLDLEPTEVGAGVLNVDAAMNDMGIVTGTALSPLVLRDEQTGAILIEDTAALWGNAQWGAGYLYQGGFNWSDAGGTLSLDGSQVSANGFLWTDSGIWANGFLWSDEGGGSNNIWARGFLWSDEGGGTGARSLLEQGADGAQLSDDP